MGESIEIRRKRLRYQCSHRGTKELDYLLGRFTEAHVARLTAEQLDRFEALLANPDPDIYRWIRGGEPVPEEFDSDVIRLIKNFTYQVLSPEISE